MSCMSLDCGRNEWVINVNTSCIMLYFLILVSCALNGMFIYFLFWRVMVLNCQLVLKYFWFGCNLCDLSVWQWVAWSWHTAVHSPPGRKMLSAGRTSTHKIHGRSLVQVETHRLHFNAPHLGVLCHSVFCVTLCKCFDSQLISFFLRPCTFCVRDKPERDSSRRGGE